MKTTADPRLMTPRSLIGCPGLILTAVSLFTLLFFFMEGFSHSSPGTSNILQLSCDGDSPKHHAKQSDVLWDPSLFLSITLGFGSLNFAAAKGLDFAWDLFIGSGGQCMLVWLLYPLFRRLLFAEMEHRRIGIPTYAAMACGGMSFGTIWTMFQSNLSRNGNRAGSFTNYKTWVQQAGLHDNQSDKKRRRPRLFWPCIAFCFTYLMAFAKVLSIMTGYQAIATPVFRLPGPRTSLTPHRSSRRRVASSLTAVDSILPRTTPHTMTIQTNTLGSRVRPRRYGKQ